MSNSVQWTKMEMKNTAYVVRGSNFLTPLNGGSDAKTLPSARTQYRELRRLWKIHWYLLVDKYLIPFLQMHSTHGIIYTFCQSCPND